MLNMLGNPKFTIGEMVEIRVNSLVYKGTVAVVDAYGTFEYTKDVSYDIWLEEDGHRVLFKHIPEMYVNAVEE